MNIYKIDKELIFYQLQPSYIAMIFHSEHLYVVLNMNCFH